MSRKKGKTSVFDETELLHILNDFKSWLEKKRLIEGSNQFSHVLKTPFSSEDWLMRVDEERKEVSFNTFLLDRCPYDYFKVIVLHEFFHLVVQKVPNKEDAVRVKDDFGDQLMKLIDIEADYFVALYYKEVLGFSLVQYLELYYEGNVVFADKRIRITKFERFIGSLLSVSKMFVNKSDNTSGIEQCDLYLTSISPIYTESSLHVLVVRKEHIHFDEIDAKYDDFVKLKECYTNVDELTKKEYVKRLVNFACRALKIKMPDSVKKEIDAIKKQK